jgi:hypothetical protein
MPIFYAALLDRGQPPTAALRAAQLALLHGEEQRWRAPYYWAGLAHQGDWRWPAPPQSARNRVSGERTLAETVSAQPSKGAADGEQEGGQRQVD